LQLSRSHVDGASSSARVLCFGEALFDSIASPRCNGWTLEQALKDGDWTDYPGGAPANVACALSRLGVNTAFAGALGNDKDGKELLKLFKVLGVSTEFSQSKPQYPTRKVMVTRANDGDRIFAGFVDGKSSFDFADCHFETANGIDYLYDAVTSAVVVGTLGLAHGPTAQTMTSLANKVKSRSQNVQGPLLVVDVNWRDKFWPSSTPAEENLARSTIKNFISGADIVKLTDQEVQ
jgi:fructokinase